MRKQFLFLLLLACFGLAHSQDSYKTTKGSIHFNASTPLEDIDATNTRVNAILKADTGDFAVVLLIKDFQFRKRLMQEHFNENYMESHTFPKGYFRGNIKDFSMAGLDDGAKTYEVEGELTIHGVSRKLQTTAELRKDGNTIGMKSTFTVTPESHDIEVPRILFAKIAREVKVAVDLKLQETLSPSE